MTFGVFILAAYFTNLWNHLHSGINLWTLFGLTGNFMFTSRFVVQWYASEKLRQSVIPNNFWHLSLVGGLINLIYAVHTGVVPFILGSLLPPVIAARNLMIIARSKSKAGAAGNPGGSEPAPAHPLKERLPSGELMEVPLPDDGSGAPTAASPPEEIVTR